MFPYFLKFWSNRTVHVFCGTLQFSVWLSLVVIAVTSIVTARLVTIAVVTVVPVAAIVNVFVIIVVLVAVVVSVLVVHVVLAVVITVADVVVDTFICILFFFLFSALGVHLSVKSYMNLP